MTVKEKAKKQTVKRLVVPFQVKAAEDPASHTFEGLAAVIGQKDLGNDIIEPGAFANTLSVWKKSGDALPLLNSHDQYNIMSALGQLIEAKEQKTGLWTRWEVIPGPEGDAVMTRLSPSKVTGRPIIGKISIGYIPVKWEIEQPEGTSSYWDQIRHLTEVELKECSLVLFPMAPGAAIDASTVKSFLLSAQMTEAKSLDLVAKNELRKLATRIGILLKKQEDPTPIASKSEEDEEDEETKAKKTPKPKSDPEHPQTSEMDGDDETEDGEDVDLDVVAELSKDDSLDEEDDDADTEDEADVAAEKPKKGKKKSTDEDPDVKAAEPYVFQEALQHRLQRQLLKNRVSSIGADSE